MYLENFIVVILQSSAVPLKPNPSQGLKLLPGKDWFSSRERVPLKPNPSQGLKQDMSSALTTEDKSPS